MRFELFLRAARIEFVVVSLVEPPGVLKTLAQGEGWFGQCVGPDFLRGKFTAQVDVENTGGRE